MQNLVDLITSFNSLPECRQDVLTKYRASGPWACGTSLAYDINNLLLTSQVPCSGAAAGIIADLDKAIASAGRLTKPLTVYRVVGDISGMGSLVAGTLWHVPTYLSTSLFTNNLHTHLIPPPSASLPEAGMLTIRLPEGTGVAFLGGPAHASKEAELLLGRDHTFRLISQSAGNVGTYAFPIRIKLFSALREITLELVT
jgi:ADP-ribosyltransferase exoenzyme